MPQQWIGDGVCDVHGWIRSEDDFDCREIPRTWFGLFRDRARRDRDDARREAKSNGNANGLSWDVVLQDDGAGHEDGRLALAIFLVREEGRLAISPISRWPYGSYRVTARQLFSLNPVRYKNGKGEAKGTEVVKGWVVSEFSRRLWAFRVKHSHRIWTYAEVRAEVERELGSPNKRVHHRKYR